MAPLIISVSAMRDSEVRSSIADFFDDKTIFITGSTGFLGKVLVHKLLSSCQRIRRIYLLIRSDVRKGTDPLDRLSSLLEAPIFDSIKSTCPKQLEKLSVIPGDITAKNLGISAADQSKLINEVNVIFHSAATVKFDEELGKSINMNVEGTRRMLNLAKKMLHLNVFVHVSTAYVHCHLDKNETIKERIVVNHSLSPTLGMEVDPTLRPNTYTLTKAMAEQLIFEEGQELPLVIVRPSIVVAALREPIPGWIDNLNGPTGN